MSSFERLHNIKLYILEFLMESTGSYLHSEDRMIRGALNGTIAFMNIRTPVGRMYAKLLDPVKSKDEVMQTSIDSTNEIS